MSTKKTDKSVADNASADDEDTVKKKKGQAKAREAERKAKAKQSAENRTKKAEQEKIDAKLAKEKAKKEAEEAIWQIEVARRLSALTTQVDQLNPETLGIVTEALQEADELPKQLILKGKLKIAEKEEDSDVTKLKSDLKKLKKAQCLKTLRNKLEKQLA